MIGSAATRKTYKITIKQKPFKSAQKKKKKTKPSTGEPFVTQTIVVNREECAETCFDTRFGRCPAKCLSQIADQIENEKNFKI